MEKDVIKEVFVIHLVKWDNDGNTLIPVNNAFKRTLFDIFGGFTSVSAVGYWKDTLTGNVYTDSVERIVIAAPVDAHSEHVYLALAQRYAANARQKCVYCIVNGEVHFVEPTISGGLQ